MTCRFIYPTACKAHMYADDTTIFIEGKNLNEMEKLVNVDAANLHNWCTENGLIMKASKTKCMLITPQEDSQFKSILGSIYQ